MTTMNRRDAMLGMLSMATAPYIVPRAASAQDNPLPLTAIPPEGVGSNISHVSYSDVGGHPDTVQVMVNRNHLYVGHMFHSGVTILDATDPRNLKPVGSFTGGDYTRTHHLQSHGDLLLLANGANIVAMQDYNSMRGYFENNLADSITNEKKFRSGLSIHDISKPDEMPEIAFLEMPGFGINRLYWHGGRYAYISAHFDGFTDTILAIVDLNEPTKPEIVSKWWLPGMHRAGGEEPIGGEGKRIALHHMIPAGDLGYAAWRDGGFTIHDISDKSNPKLVSHINWSPPFPGGTHTPMPLPGRDLCIVADEANAENCAKGTFHTFILDVRAPENPVPISTLPTPTDRDFCSLGTFGPHNLHENRDGSFQSEEIIVATYNNAGVRIFDIADAFSPKEIAFWVPPRPAVMTDPRTHVSRAGKSCDAYMMADGLIYCTDWNGGLHVLQYDG